MKWISLSLLTALLASSAAYAQQARPNLLIPSHAQTSSALGHGAAGAAPTFIINFIATGPNQSGVPCFNCVGGASGYTLGIPVPDNEEPVNYYWQYNISWTNISFVGSCKVTLQLMGGNKVVDTVSTTVKNIHGAGPLDWAFARPHPAYSGLGTATGKVKCGSSTQSVSTTMLFD